MRWKRRKKEMPTGLWLQCPSCKKPIFKQEMEKRLKVCPECIYHFPLNSAERVAATLDPDTFEEIDADLEPVDRLEFVDTKPYPERLEAAQKKTGLKDAAVIGTGKVRGIPVAFGILDFSFMGGSRWAWVVGERDHPHHRAGHSSIALPARGPLSASGGARMHGGRPVAHADGQDLLGPPRAHCRRRRGSTSRCWPTRPPAV